VLSKITPPTKGRIISRGRIASLLEVGTGFHPELTGRENIFFNGSLLGMKRKEIERNFDAIVDFSGVEKFLDTPLKHYSSGMQLRLAFAVAAFLEPEILIIDEVLAVGDAEFQKKCIGKMEDVSRSGRTILFVSHNLTAVENLCTRGLLLDKGGVVAQSNLYQETTRWKKTSVRNEPAYFDEINVELTGEQPQHRLTITTLVKSQQKHSPAFIAFDIVNSLGITVFQAIPDLTPFIPYSESQQKIVTEVELPPLIPDYYRVSAWIGPHNTETFSWDKEIVGFEINDSPMTGRNFPHSHNNGFLIASSRIVNG
jgi:lipopolysaccharide transport system ATP-binding protein